MVYMHHSFLIHLSADGHLGCFHVLAMINSAAMNIGVHVSLSDLVSSVCMPRSGNQSFLKSTLNIHWKDWCLGWIPIFWATWWEELTHWKRHWCWERLRARGEEGDRGWNGWMASLVQWTWVWANSGRKWRTGKPGVLQFMVLQRVGHDFSDWTTTTLPQRWGDKVFLYLDG